MKLDNKDLQKCKLTMLTERERHGMAELLGRMDPVDLISLAQVNNEHISGGLESNKHFLFSNLSI